MKLNLILLCCLLTAAATAQDQKYLKAMEKNVAMVDTAKTLATLTDAGNAFERIGSANPKEWLPVYYQAYCNVMIGLQQQENSRKEEYFENADKLATRADSVSPDNSEIYVLRSFITSMKISIDPATRGQKLGPLASSYTDRAIELDKENPRAYLLKGSGLMFRPAAYGGGKDKALPVLEEAVAKFKSFKPASPIMPHWGEARAVTMLEQCKKVD